MKKVLTVIGARPQFIKAATVSRALESVGGIEEVLLHTGQHYDDEMSGIFFRELGIKHPNINLGIGGGGHGEMTGRQLEGIESALVDVKPDGVIVYGDTNSTLAGALAAAKLHIPVYHVESGLRSFNRDMPEELNRVLTDHLSALLFAPSINAASNLRLEGIADELIHVVGDVMNDAALMYLDKAKMPDGLNAIDGVNSGFVLATIHRAESTGDKSVLEEILKGLGACGSLVILPMHPRTKKVVQSAGIKLSKNIAVIDPVGYLEMLWLLSRCASVATDSGGVQKEAYYLRKPCVTLRRETEWVELVESGWNVLPEMRADSIAEVIRSVESPVISGASSLYGGGNASCRVADCIKTALY